MHMLHNESCVVRVFIGVYNRLGTFVAMFIDLCVFQSVEITPKRRISFISIFLYEEAFLLFFVQLIKR